MGGWNKGLPAPWVARDRKGKKLAAFIANPQEAMTKRTQTRLARFGGHYVLEGSQQAGIAKRPSMWKANVTTANRQRNMKGSANPFYGKRHPPEIQAKITAAITGRLNPHWAGGIATLPYGPGFTRRFKRLIRDRDGQQCVRCQQTRTVSGQALDVHHIDHDKANNDPSNLVTLCHPCNIYFSYHREESLTTLPHRRMLLR